MPSSVQPESDDVEVEIEGSDDLHASSESPRDDVEVEIEGTDNPRANSEALHDGDPQAATELPPDPTSDPKTAEDEEAARYQRFCALAEQVVPNKTMWSTVYHPPTIFFAADELPFEQKKLFCGGREFWDSLMFECIASMASVLASMFALYTFIVREVLLNTSDGSFSDAVLALTVGPLLFGLVAAVSMPEHPARLLLYYRLWEQKIIIDFKERGLTDPTTFCKVVLVAATIVVYLGYGLISEDVTDKWNYTVVVLQSLGGMGLTVYNTLSVAPFLQDTNGSLKHYQAIDKEKNDASPQTYRDRAAKTIEQIQFIPEWRVKYDILAIQAYGAEVLSPKLRAANLMDANEPTDMIAVAQCKEEEKWLKVLGMWIGRLGNSKESYMARWGGKYSHATRVKGFALYGTNFVLGDHYDDDGWHVVGSFRQMNNVTGSTRVLQTFLNCAFAAIIAIEVYGLFSGAAYTARDCEQ